MKKILFFLAILLISLETFSQAPVNPIPVYSPYQFKIKTSPATYTSYINTTFNDSMNIGYGATDFFYLRNTGSAIVLNDNNSNKVGIGATNPITKFQVFSTITTRPRGITNSQHSATADGANLNMYKSRGTAGTPSVIVTGDTLGSVMWRGYDGGQYYQAARIDVLSTGTIAPSRIGSNMIFKTTPSTVLDVPTEAMRITSAQRIGIGVASPQYKVDINGDVKGQSFTPYNPRYWTDTMTVTRINDSSISFVMPSTTQAVQFCNSEINHVIRWKKWNGAVPIDSTKCALISQATNVTTTVTLVLIGDYFLNTDRLTSVSYTVYDKVQFYEWFVSGLMVADTNTVGIRRSWDTLKTIRIIASAGRLGTKGTGTIKFAYNLYLGSSPLGGYAIMETIRNYNYDGYLKRTNRPINARRIVPGGYWIVLKTPIASGTTVPQDLYIKLWWIEAKLLDAN